jgi:hypothetical protein
MSRNFMIRLSVAIVGAVVILVGFSCNPKPEPERKRFDSPPKKLPPPRRKTSTPPAPTPAKQAKAVEVPPRANWEFVDSKDRLGLGTDKYAVTKSLNKVRFDFPYDGDQNAVIALRTGPRGSSAIFRVEKGQILARQGILVVFDNEPPHRFSLREPLDGSSNAVFIADYDAFYNALTAASRVKVEVSFYQEGTHVFEFDVRDTPANEAP